MPSEPPPPPQQQPQQQPAPHSAAPPPYAAAASTPLRGSNYPHGVGASDGVPFCVPPTPQHASGGRDTDAYGAEAGQYPPPPGSSASYGGGYGGGYVPASGGYVPPSGGSGTGSLMGSRHASPPRRSHGDSLIGQSLIGSHHAFLR